GTVAAAGPRDRAAPRRPARRADPPRPARGAGPRDFRTARPHREIRGGPAPAGGAEGGGNAWREGGGSLRCEERQRGTLDQDRLEIAVLRLLEAQDGGLATCPDDLPDDDRDVRSGLTDFLADQRYLEAALRPFRDPPPSTGLAGPRALGPYDLIEEIG